MSQATIQQIFRQFTPEYLKLYTPSTVQRKAINKIIDCRTEKLGTRIYKCQKCGEQIFAYDSCKDRNCPNCQNYKKEVWIEKHQEDILNTPYFHVVMTAPAELHPIFYHNQGKMYNLLFRAAKETIIELCEDPKYLGAKVGITAMLHTWSQKANYHPHVHMIVTGGGLTKRGKFKYSKKDYLLPIKVVSKKFRGKLLSFIKEEKGLNFYGEYKYLNDKIRLKKYLSSLYEKEWVCYSKNPSTDVSETYNYLGRYAFKICMTNDRIIKIKGENVWFKYRDRKDGSKNKITKVKGVEFIRRYLMHVLPKGFMKIRYYGILSSKNKKERLKILKRLTKTAKNLKDKLTKLELLNKINERDVTICEKCGGETILVQTIHPPPDNYNRIIVRKEA